MLSWSLCYPIHTILLYLDVFVAQLNAALVWHQSLSDTV